MENDKDTEVFSPASIKIANYDNVRDVLYFQHQKYISKFLEFLNKGDYGYLAYLDEKCVHRSWVKSNQQKVSLHWAIPYQLKLNEHFVHYCETAPEARGKNIYPAVLSRIVGDFKAKGKILIAVNTKNMPSIKGIRKAGFRERERDSASGPGDKNQNKKGLRIVVITQGVSHILNPLVKSHYKVVGVIESAPRNFRNKRGKKQFLGFIRQIYKTFKKKITTLRGWCSCYKIPYFFMTSSYDNGLEDWIQEKSPDIVLVFSMSQLLKKNILSIPRLGIINMHPSYLPEYRGPNPYIWQYIHMGLQPGITIHYIDEGEDTGDIIYQERVNVAIGTKLDEFRDKLIINTGVPLLLKALDAIQNGTAPRIKQPKSSPTVRARNLKTEEQKNIINWDNWSIERIWHILLGTEQRLNILPQPKGIYKGQYWLIGSYQKCPMENLQCGQI